MPIKTTNQTHPTPSEPHKRAPMACLAIVLALLTLTDAQAQQRTIYGSDGKVTGRVTTDSQGSQTIYGADGRVSGRTSTDSQGTTTIYDASGRKTGSVTTTKPQTGK